MLKNKNSSFTKLSSLGEFGLIERLTSKFKPSNKQTIKSIGDDAAVLDFNHKKTVISTDFLIQGIHFDLTYMPLKHLGYKAVIVNLSDIYAMNAIPTQITFSIAVSDRFPVEALEELYEGVHLACQRHNVDLVGGDTTSSLKGLVISVTAIGEAEESKLAYRDGAKESDLLVVSGDLGGSYLGLQILEREKQVFEVNPNSQPDIEKYSYLIEKQLKPEARKDIIKLLADLDIKPTSMIDISDGLASEILHLCKQSGLGCTIYEEKIPIDPLVMTTADELNLSSLTCALNGGEDYELLFSISQKDYDKIKNNVDLTVIGHMTGKNNGAYLVNNAEQQIELKAQGWTPFKE